MHNRHLKVQYATVFFVFIVLSVFCVFASMAFHMILIGTDRAPTYYPIKECIESIKTVKKHRLLFLCFEGLSFCLAAALMVSYSRNYISKLQSITPKIYTPVAAGQNQFGSARWMTEKEKGKAFDTAVINYKDDFYKALLAAGKNEKAIIKKHVIDKEDKQEHKKLHFQHIKLFVERILPKEKRHILREKLRLNYDEILRKYYPSLWQMKQQRNIDKLVGLFECEFDVLKEAASNVEIKTNSIEAIANPQCFNSGGLVIGMKKLRGGKELFYYIGDDAHLIGIGVTRSGKSRTLVIQSICFLALAGESMIVSDLKGELNQYTGTFLKRLGYNVIILDFKNPLKSDRYNLLQPIIDAIEEDNIPKATECVWDLVGILVGDAKGEKIWNYGEVSTIACAIMSVVYDNREGESIRP